MALGSQAWAPRGSLLLRAAVFAVLATLAAATDAAGTKYLEENSQREGVVTRPSGLQYEVLTKATDPLAVSPGPSDRCKVHYEGKLLDGTVFDSTRGGFGRPATFAPNQVIRGWTEALQLMKEGEKWRLAIPSDLAYGRRGAGGKIPPDAALIFEIELVSVSAGGASAILPDWLAAIADRTVIEPIRVWHMFCFFVVIVVVQLMLPGGPRVSASHILIKGAESEAKTAALKAKLADAPKAEVAARFAALAAEHSECPSKSAGGALGEFGKGAMVPEFDACCWTAPIGEVQGPVRTGFGHHLILVTARSTDEKPKAA